MVAGIGAGTGCGVALFPFACSVGGADAAGWACGTVEIKNHISIWIADS